MAEMTVYFAEMVRAFDVEVVQLPKVISAPKLTLEPVPPLLIKLHPVSK